MSTELLLIWSTGATAALAVLLMLLVLCSRWLINRQSQRLKRDREFMRPLVIRYLVGDATLEEAAEQASLRLAATSNIIFSLSASLSGSAKLALIVLARETGLVKRLLKGLQGRNWRVRERSAALIGMLMLPESVPKLVKLLDDPCLEVRQTAARSLAMSSTTAGFSAFLELLKTPGKVELSRLLEIVQYVPQPKVEPIAEMFEGDAIRDEEKLLLLSYITDWCDYRFIGLLEHLLDSEDLEIKLGAIKTLSRIEAHEAIPRMVVDIDHPAWEVRVQVIRAIQRLEFVEAIPLLIRALEDESYWVRYVAAQTLTIFGVLDEDEIALAAEGDEFAKQMFHYHTQRTSKIIAADPKAMRKISTGAET
jgi:hypothetical protein